jgi:hypothetical protein
MNDGRLVRVGISDMVPIQRSPASEITDHLFTRRV